MKIKNYYILRRNERVIASNEAEKKYLVKTNTTKTLYRLYINEKEYKVDKNNIMFNYIFRDTISFSKDKQYIFFNDKGVLQTINFSDILRNYENTLYYKEDGFLYKMNENLIKIKQIKIKDKSFIGNVYIRSTPILYLLNEHDVDIFYKNKHTNYLLLSDRDCSKDVILTRGNCLDFYNNKTRYYSIQIE